MFLVSQIQADVVMPTNKDLFVVKEPAIPLLDDLLSLGKSMIHCKLGYLVRLMAARHVTVHDSIMMFPPLFYFDRVDMY